MRQCGFTVRKEERYHVKNGEWVRKLSRPGDLFVEKWKFDNDGNELDDAIGDMYFDVTVGNVFAQSYIKHTANEKLWLAKEKEKEKKKKYDDRDDICGLGLECLGGMSPKFRLLLQCMAGQLEERTEINRSIWMNRMRSRIMMELIFYNCKMVQACYNLYSVDEELDDDILDEDLEI